MNGSHDWNGNSSSSGSSRKRVAVIGAGASGLAAIKTCLEEGLNPVCFEQENFIGGLWHFTPEERHSTVYKSTVINTSKEMMAFSDFPIPKHYPPFMHNQQIIEYFEEYMKHFGLRKYIQFETKVVFVAKAPDYDSTGRWLARTSSRGNEKEEIFDAVMVASGHHWKSKIPQFKGIDIFEGKQRHSHAYKDPSGLEDKTVVVVGIGNSGVDIAVEASRVAKQVILSTRSGAYIFERINDKGHPADMDYNNRMIAWMPLSFRNFIFTDYIKKRHGDLSNFGLKPNFPVLSAHPTINGELLGRIVVGKISVYPNVHHLTKNSVVFENGVEVKVDEIVYSTGYEISFPYLSSAEITVNENEVNLYKFVFPPDHKHPTLSFLGLIQPWGAIMPIAELQARWITRILSGKLALASPAEMKKDIANTREIMRKRYVKSPRHTIQVDYVNYMDEIAKLLGVYPSFMEVLRKKPSLLPYVLAGPAVPAQYRLFGPNSWDKAEDVVRNVYKNSDFPYQTREIQQDDQVKNSLGLFDATKGIALLGAALILTSKL